MVFTDRANEVAADAVRIVGIGFVYGERIPVELIQSILGSHPHETPAILENAPHRALRHALLERYLLEFDLMRVYAGC